MVATGKVRVGLTVLLVCATLIPACSNESVKIIEEEIVFEEPADPELPDGFVAANRPTNPGTTYSLLCPLAVVPGGMGNENSVLGCPTVSLDKDCIQAIEEPKFATAKEAESFMRESERLIAIERRGRVLGIPIRILVWQEVVNICWQELGLADTYSVLTYCPLVDVALHFNDDSVECSGPRKFGLGYGVSGLLYNGNLVMTKRQKVKTFFVQMLGGGFDPGCLEPQPVIFDMSFGMFRRLFPRGRVMTDDTGLVPPPKGYDLYNNPYAKYWMSDDLALDGWRFPVANVDPRLPNKRPVYGVLTPAGPKAYPIAGIVNNKPIGSYVVNDAIGDYKVVVWNEQGFASTAAYERIVNGQELTFGRAGRDRQHLPLFIDEETGTLWTFDGIAVDGPLEGERLAHVFGHRSFWFAWAAFWPKTELREFGGTANAGVLMY